MTAAAIPAGSSPSRFCARAAGSPASGVDEVGLGDVEHGQHRVHRPHPAPLPRLALPLPRGGVVVGFDGAVAEDPDAFLPSADLPAEGLPLPEPGHACGGGALGQDQQHVGQAVGVECAREGEEPLPLPRLLQRLHLNGDRFVQRLRRLLPLLDADAAVNRADHLRPLPWVSNTSETSRPLPSTLFLP